ncbi:MAG: methyltransferase domain-containing protein [Lachnospiraceae bacterium]|nr:methyltransferase domain-containing protein [Lachnospiraceae bacterium]
MNHKLCETIKNLRTSRNISQELFANALDISAQAVSKWENKKALPDISLLPKIADFFGVTIDTLFKGFIQEDDILSDNISTSLEQNKKSWDKIASKDWLGTSLPAWGVLMANEEKLNLLYDLTGKKVLEIACGDGKSLIYCGKNQAKELFGIDISEKQLAKARQNLLTENIDAKLFLSPMEVNPGIPEHYFDLVYSVYGIGWTQDLDKTISLIGKYLKTNGTFIFSWDNPILPCIENINEEYVLKHSYLDELLVQVRMREEMVVRTNWKLSTYINTLAKNGFKVEYLIENSAKPENAVYSKKYYSEHKAQYINHSFVLKARKL